MKTDAAIVSRELDRSELKHAANLLGRAMRDNPANVRAFGIEQSERRSQALERFFVPVLDGLFRRGKILGAFHQGALAGVCAMASPGGCQPGPLEKLRILPAVVLGNPPGAAPRILKWSGEWARRDPVEPHWHLGPVGVAPQLWGQGIGSVLLTEFCARMDAARAQAYLETDKPENVGFYRKFGFTVTAEAAVLGTPNWFMLRVPASEGRC